MMLSGMEEQIPRGGTLDKFPQDTNSSHHQLLPQVYRTYDSSQFPQIMHDIGDAEKTGDVNKASADDLREQ